MHYDIGLDFDAYPMGRPLGKEFRERVLVPRLRQLRAESQGRKLIISLDHCRTFGSSFLEEAFGGLVRVEGFSPRELERLMDIVASHPNKAFFISAIWSYIRQARR